MRTETAAVVHPRTPRVGVSWPSITIILLYLFSLHAYLPVPIPGNAIPFGVAIVIAAGIFLVDNQKWPTQVVRLLVAISAIASIGIVTGPSARAFLGQRVVTTGFFAASLFAAIVIYQEMKMWPATTMRRLFGCISIVLIVGALFEVFTPVKQISDAFRSAVALKGVLYTADLRDLMDTGIIRPKFFSLEPSILASGVGLTALLWLMLAYDDRWRMVKFAALIVGGFAIIRSPTVLVYFPAGIFVAYLSAQPGEARGINYTRRMLIVVGLGVLCLPLIYVLAEQLMAERLQKILAGRDASTLVRLLLPPLLTWRVLTDNPLFGIGLGGKNAIIHETLGTVMGLRLNPSYLIETGGIEGVFPIPAIEYWATFGLLGGTIILVFLRRLLRLLTSHDAVAILFSILCMSLAGGYVGGTYFWSACALLVVTSHVRWRDTQRITNAPSRPELMYDK